MKLKEIVLRAILRQKKAISVETFCVQISSMKSPVILIMPTVVFSGPTQDKMPMRIGFLRLCIRRVNWVTMKLARSSKDVYFSLSY